MRADFYFVDLNRVVGLDDGSCLEKEAKSIKHTIMPECKRPSGRDSTASQTNSAPTAAPPAQS
ncbi:MAG: hypothetical protein BroJett011_61730 [Chloroflexota bacterium]|nr:MAG: hypothetical protein BroJett011_61730 [Chloroflexota bacterium]